MAKQLFNQFELIGLLVASLTVFYLYIRHKLCYWKRYKIPFIEPLFLFGNFLPSFLQKVYVGELCQEFYRSTQERFVGIYAFTRPILLVCDPALIRTIFIKDFSYFVDRGVYLDERNDPLSGHLFSLTGDKWKTLRNKLSPVFTSGKLKAMFPTMTKCGETLERFLRRAAKYQEPVEVKDLAARYTTDIIASVAFGLEINSIDNPNTSFRRYGRKAMEPSLKNGIRILNALIFPGVAKYLNIKSVDDDVEKFMMNVVRENLTLREKESMVRKDFFQLLVQLRNGVKLNHNDNDMNWNATTQIDESKQTMTFNEIAAQAWVFYIAGFDTSSATASFCMFELAKNFKLQCRVQKEIDEMIAKYGDLTYDCVGDMTYLDMCIEETLRIYPPVPILNRQCAKPYQIPGTNIILEKGTQILIPAMGIQRDSKYYPEPMTFNPGRFKSEHNKDKLFIEQPMMPFGDGPRNCIGMRLGKLQTKIALITMLRHNNYELNKKTKPDMILSTNAALMQSKDGIYLNVTARKN